MPITPNQRRLLRFLDEKRNASLLAARAHFGWDLEVFGQVIHLCEDQQLIQKDGVRATLTKIGLDVLADAIAGGELKGNYRETGNVDAPRLPVDGYYLPSYKRFLRAMGKSR